MKETIKILIDDRTVEKLQFVTADDVAGYIDGQIKDYSSVV